MDLIFVGAFFESRYTIRVNKKIATLISRIFDPFVSLVAVFVLLFWNSKMMIPAFFLMVLLPLGLFFFAWKTKIISNWDVTDRRERPKILWMLFGIIFLSTILLRATVVIPILVALFGFAVISHFWKISGHTMAAALATGEIVHRLGWHWWPVLLIVPLLGWARVLRKDHTLAQVVMGAAFAWGLLLIMK